MSYTNCLNLMRALGGKTQFAGVVFATAIAARLLVEQSINYRVNDDLYYYNQSTLQLFLLTNGVASLIGVAS